MFLGAQLVLTDQPVEALPHLEEALELRSGTPTT